MTTAERITAAKAYMDQLEDKQRAWLSKRSVVRRQWTSGDWSEWAANRVTREEAVEDYRRAREAAMEVTQVDRPYWDASGVFRGRWVVHVVESDGVIVRPRDQVFGSKDEADAYYGEMIAA